MLLTCVLKELQTRIQHTQGIGHIMFLDYYDIVQQVAPLIHRATDRAFVTHSIVMPQDTADSTERKKT